MLCVAGIDYSMTSPAICIHRGDEWSPDNCTIHFLASRRSHLINSPRLKATEYRNDFTFNEPRFDWLSRWACGIIQAASPSRIVIEGYAMGAKGQVFHIAENTGLLKHALWKIGFKFDTPAPTAVKKFATGKGNAKKEDLERAFVEETGWDVRHELNQSAKSWNPSSDIIDAYFMAKYAFHHHHGS